MHRGFWWRNLKEKDNMEDVCLDEGQCSNES